MPTIEIRLAQENERAELFGMAQRYRAELMPHAPVVRDPSLRLKYFEEEFQLKSGSFQWWAMLDGARIGFANLELSKDWDGAMWANIKDFYIESNYRRKGYGRAFVQKLVSWMREQRVYRIDLHIRSDNPHALEFWKAVGFELASYRLRQYVD